MKKSTSHWIEEQINLIELIGVENYLRMQTNIEC